MKEKEKKMSQYFKTKYNDLEGKWKSKEVGEKGKEKREKEKIEKQDMLEEVRSQSHKNLFTAPQPSTTFISKQKLRSAQQTNRWRTKGSRKEGASHKLLRNTGE